MDKNIKDIQMEKDYVKNLIEYRDYNSVIAKYFYKYALEKNSKKFLGISNNIKSCNMIWDVDFYKDLSLKDFKKTFLCKNKFCFNCKKVLQAFRMAKYMPMIKKEKNLYHLVLTVPNVQADDLKDTLKEMSKAFRRFYRILRGDDKFKMPFKFNITGAIRSLEITFSDKGFHPHYHVLLSMETPVEKFEKTKVNKFSYNYSVLTTLFSEQEVYLQKLWYCLYNSINLSKVKEEEVGYSVILDKFKDEDFCELFKYMCKEKAFLEDGEMLLTYEFFKVLYESTFRLKQIQGYGIFYSIDKDDFDYDDIDGQYDEFILNLRKSYDYETKLEFLSQKDYDDFLEKKTTKDSVERFKGIFEVVDLSKYKYISRKLFVKLAQDLHKQDENILRNDCIKIKEYEN